MMPNETRAADESVDPPPVEIVNSTATLPLLIIADHAGRAVPRRFHDAVGPMGLPPEAFDLHIAWDIGAGGVARRLATRLEVTAVLAVYTRLLIDLNRPLGNADCIPTASDGTPIAANQGLSHSDLAARADAFYWPYHRAVDLELSRLMRGGVVPLLLSVHSFTPRLQVGSAPRPWHAGVMASRDRRFADALMAGLTALGHTVGFNEPYSGVTHGYCIKVHGLARGLPHVQLEIRQDLIGTDRGQEEWAGSLAAILTPLLSGGTLQSIDHC